MLYSLVYCPTGELYLPKNHSLLLENLGGIHFRCVWCDLAVQWSVTFHHKTGSYCHLTVYSLIALILDECPTLVWSRCPSRQQKMGCFAFWCTSSACFTVLRINLIRKSWWYFIVRRCDCGSRVTLDVWEVLMLILIVLYFILFDPYFFSLMSPALDSSGRWYFIILTAPPAAKRQ